MRLETGDLRLETGGQWLKKGQESLVSRGPQDRTSFQFLAGVVIFPGSNCETDTFNALEYLGFKVEYIWHQQTSINDFDVIILPGGFSYGDYLRCGAVARFSPVMGAVAKYAAAGGLVLGICNGFQILLEAGLLPGAMLPNKHLKFICRNVYLRVENTTLSFTNLCKPGEILQIPINHYEGNYFIDPEGLNRIESNGQVVLRYVDAGGKAVPEAAPNGALANIAGICNESGNVFGLMPHPERAVEAVLGLIDGQKIFKSMVGSG